MGDASLLNNYLVVGGLIFSLGVVGFLTRRNLIVMFLCAELMLQGVSLTLVGFSSYQGSWGGQVLTVFSLALAGAEAAIALALIVVLFRQSKSLDISLWQELREPDQPEVVDEYEVEAPLPEDHWPELTTAGRLPGQTESPKHRTLKEAIAEKRQEPAEVPHA